MASQFDCKCCGHCCEGSGGILVSPREVERLCLFLNMPCEAFKEQYTEEANGKLRLCTSKSGFCVFFTEGVGCGVHEAKPDVCRAWPFFRGNLIDPVSLELAKDYCPGIPKDMKFDDFVNEGVHYLHEADLIHDDSRAHALNMDGIVPKKCS